METEKRVEYAVVSFDNSGHPVSMDDLEFPITDPTFAKVRVAARNEMGLRSEVWAREIVTVTGPWQVEDID